MYQPLSPSTHLPDRVYEALYNKMILPGLTEGLLSHPVNSNRHLAQHIPSSFQDAMQQRQAISPVTIVMLPARNPGVWSRIKRELDGVTSGLFPKTDSFDLAKFKDLFFVYDCKGMKVES